MSNPEERESLNRLWSNLAQLGDDNGVEFFEEAIGSKAKLREFIASLRSNWDLIIESQQSSDSNRDLILERFDELLEEPSGPEAWNSWKKYVEDCVAQYGPGVTLITSGDTIIELGPGFVSQLNATDGLLEQIKKDIEIGQNPPQFDFSRGDIARHYELPGINLSGSNLMGTRLDMLDLTNAVTHHSTFGFASLRRAQLKNADMHNALIFCADVGEAEFERTNFTNSLILDTDFKDGRLRRAIFEGAMMPGARFRNANLQRADFTNAYLKYGDFRGADLRGATLVDADLSFADISGSKVYGASVWNVNLKRAKQKDIIITKDGEPTITVDNLEVAQFIYLLLNNEKIRNVIDTVAKKVVLILGRFTEKRIAILYAIKEGLRRHGYLPVLFDFDKPTSRDFIETVSLLAHLSKFVIVDVTDARIVLEEVPHIVRNITVPVKPLLLRGSGNEPVTLYNLRRNQRSVLETYLYESQDELISTLKENVIDPAERKAEELIGK